MQSSRTLCAIVLAALVILAMVPAFRAQEEERMGFAVSMDTPSLAGRPGQVISSELRIVVSGPPHASTYECEVMDLGLSLAGDEQIVALGEGARSCAPWIRLPLEVNLQPGQRTGSVPFEITVPGEAVGEYFGYIRVKRLTAPGGERMAIMLEPAIGLRVEVSVPGRQELELSATALTYDPWLEPEQPGVILQVHNGGNMKTPLEGDILLQRGGKGWPVRVTIPVRENGKPITVYPGLTATVSCPLDEAPPPGDYRAVARLLLAGRWRTQSAFEVKIPARGVLAPTSGSFIDRAEFDIDLRVQPEYVEVALPPGASRNVSIRVQNADTAAVTLSAVVAEVQQEENGFLTFTESADTTGQWVRLPTTTLELRPRSSVPLLIEVRRPEAADSAAFGMRGIRLTGRTNWDESGWASEVDIGVPIFAVPTGAAAPRIEIEKLDLVRPDPALNPTAAVLRLRNAGERVAIVSGALRVERTVERVRIQTMNLADVLMGPGSTREFRMAMPLLDKGDFRLVADVQVRGQPASAGARRETTFQCWQGPE